MININSVTFDQFNEFLLNKIINKKHIYRNMSYNWNAFLKLKPLIIALATSVSWVWFPESAWTDKHMYYECSVSEAST